MRKVRLLLLCPLMTALAVVGPSAADAMTASSGCGVRMKPAAAAAAVTTNVWMAGDSTMANPHTGCPVGWATEFDGQFHSNIVWTT